MIDPRTLIDPLDESYSLLYKLAKYWELSADKYPDQSHRSTLQYCAAPSANASAW